MFLVVSCIIGGMTEENRKRLAQEVVARRTELGMLTTKALAEAARLTPRMLGDVENGRRENYSQGAKAQIEHALDWVYGSIDDVLAGFKPTPIVDIPQGTPDDFPEEDPLVTLEALVDQGWTTAHELAAAVIKSNPSEELLAAARDAVHLIDGHLIIRILTSGHAAEMEAWLARIYREREILYRQLSTGEPKFPWVAEVFESPEQAAAHFVNPIDDNKEKNNDVETAAQSDASPEGSEDEEVAESAPNDSEAGSAGRDLDDALVSSVPELQVNGVDDDVEKLG